VAQAFGLKLGEDLPWSAKIAGYTHSGCLSPSDSHFSDINLLGIDFCSLNGFLPRIVAGDTTVTYYIGNHWDVRDVRDVFDVEPQPKL
jgi:hypothetical protein